MNDSIKRLLEEMACGRMATADQVFSLAGQELPALMRAAARRRDAAHGNVISYSRKVFIPLTQHCRDLCHYCTFSRAPKRGARIYMTAEEVLSVARAGAAAGCTEALFTLG